MKRIIGCTNKRKEVNRGVKVSLRIGEEMGRCVEMEQVKIDRINALAKKSKTMGLTDEEKKEQQILRQEYIQAFKSNMKATLDSITIVDGDGNKRPLK